MCASRGGVPQLSSLYWIAGLSQHGVEDPLRWRMEIEGDDEGSDSEDENMADGEVSLEELNRHVSTEEQ